MTGLRRPRSQPHLFDAESPYLDSDAVFGVHDSLVVRFTKDSAGSDLVAEFDFGLED
jgi:hydroxyquinol 1,2-dioxygenase